MSSTKPLILPWHISDSCSGFRPLSRQQLALSKLGQLIMDKDNWETKLENPEIVKIWTKESLAAFDSLTPVSVQNLIQHLKSLLAAEQEIGVQPNIIPNIWQKMNLVPTELRDRFRTYVRQHLETQQPRDYHPGSNNQVVDLIHPSLYCWIRGFTKVQSPTTREFTDMESNDLIVDSDYQWIPTDFTVKEYASKENGGLPQVTIGGYINNLHPMKHAPLYPMIGEIFGLMLPLLENVFEELQSTFDEFADFEATSHHSTDDDNDDDEPDEESPEERARIREEHRASANQEYAFMIPRTPVKPASFLGKPLQVIVKIASIELTPENPVYPGGRWHIEGTEREQIVATALYYYDIENITDSFITFERPVTTPMCEQYRGMETITTLFGLSNDEVAMQQLAPVKTKEGLCLAFPNAYPHCVSAFELADRTKPGHRKIMVFFVVSPSSRVPGTDVIVPQQEEWYQGEFALPEKPDPSSLLSFDIAAKYRLVLMKDRAVFQNAFGRQIREDRTISLCEH